MLKRRGFLKTLAGTAASITLGIHAVRSQERIQSPEEVARGFLREYRVFEALVNECPNTNHSKASEEDNRRDRETLQSARQTLDVLKKIQFPWFSHFGFMLNSPFNLDQHLMNNRSKIQSSADEENSIKSLMLEISKDDVSQVQEFYRNFTHALPNLTSLQSILQSIRYRDRPEYIAIVDEYARYIANKKFEPKCLL